MDPSRTSQTTRPLKRRISICSSPNSSPKLSESPNYIQWAEDISPKDTSPYRDFNTLSNPTPSSNYKVHSSHISHSTAPNLDSNLSEPLQQLPLTPKALQLINTLPQPSVSSTWSAHSLAQAAISCLPTFRDKNKQRKFFHAFKFFITFCRYSKFYALFGRCFLKFESTADLDSSFFEILSFSASRNSKTPKLTLPRCSRETTDSLQLQAFPSKLT